MIACEKIQPDLTGFLRDELSASARTRVESHVAECRACSADLAELEVVTALAHSIPLESDPPPDLEQHVFSFVEVDDVARLVKSAPLEDEPPPDLEAASLRHAGIRNLDARQPTVQVARKRRWLPDFSRIGPVLVPGLAMLAIALGVIGFQWRSDVRVLQDELGEARSQLGPTGETLQVMELKGDDSSVRAEIIEVPNENYRVVLETDELPRTPPNHVYELWFRGPGGDTSAGSFQVDDVDEPVVATFAVGVDPHDFDEVEVWLEPQDGEPGLTGKAVAEADLNLSAPTP